MKENGKKFNRRNFLKSVGTAGLGSALAGVNSALAKAGPNEPSTPVKEAERKFPQVPRQMNQMLPEKGN